MLALSSVLQPQILVFMIPITAIVLGIGSGIIKMLTEHQQRMAQLVHANKNSDTEVLRELKSMRMELEDLRDRVNQVAINSDSLSALARSADTPPPLPEDVRERVNG